jgi:C-terminal processing protease CtpA/Prc
MKKIISSVIIFILLLSLLPTGNLMNNGYASTRKMLIKNDNSSLLKTYPLAKLREDFEELQNIIDTLSPKLFTNKKELSALYKSQYKLIKNNMSELEFFRVISPIVAKLNCGHTSISFSEEYSKSLNKNGRYLPLNIKIINNKAYVYQNLSKAEIPTGAEILSINGKSIKNIISILLKNITADGTNTSKKYYIMNNWFKDQYYNFVDNSTLFKITYIDPSDNKTKDSSLAAASMEALNSLSKKLSPSTNEDSIPYSSEFEQNYAVITIKSFGFYDSDGRNKFKAFIDGFFKELKERSISNLILDVRDNWGGDPYCSAHLFSYLLKTNCPYFEKSTPYYYDLTLPIKPAQNNFTGNLYTLINGASFSSTGHLCALLKFNKIGVFIGEESGGSYVCTDGSIDKVLSNTQIKLHISTTKYSVAVTGLTPGRGIIPDLPVTSNIQDYIDNRDTIKISAINLINK